MKKYVCVLMASLFILSSMSMVTFASANDNSVNYNYLKNYLIKNGAKTNSSYCISTSDVQGNYRFFWGVYYDTEEKEIYFSCSQSALDLSIEINQFLYITPYYDKGYEIGLIASQSKYNYLVFGQGTIYPEKYKSGDSLYYKKSDSSYKPVTDVALDDLATSNFKVAVIKWEELLENNLDMSLGDFGFIKLYSPSNTAIQVVTSNAIIKIKNNPGTTTQNYGTILVLNVEITDAPEDCSYVWYFNGENTNISDGPGYVNCGLRSCTVTVKLVDSNGVILVDPNGNEISDTEKINVKSNIFVIFFAIIRQLIFGQNIIYQ